MKKNPNSVFGFPYNKKYYLTHPHKWLKQLGRNLRAAWMRCTKGWCYYDVWDWDMWFMTTVPPMFRHLAKYGHGYPGFEPFETPEKWQNWLNEIADQIESCTEEAQANNNEYYEEYMKHIMDRWEPFKDENGVVHLPHHGLTELDEKYFARAKELGAKADEDIKDALNQIGENFTRIWD